MNNLEEDLSQFIEKEICLNQEEKLILIGIIKGFELLNTVKNK